MSGVVDHVCCFCGAIRLLLNVRVRSLASRRYSARFPVEDMLTVLLHVLASIDE